MIITTWDGHLRVDRPEAGDSVTVTLLTVEPTTEGRLRTGLAAEFVTDDPDGPPARLVVAAPDGRLPDDVATLVGTRISAAATELVGGSGGAWLRLDLTEVDRLAAAWAPYRVRVLAPAPAEGTPGVVGTWARDLWTALEIPDLSPLTGTATAPVFRGDPFDVAGPGGAPGPDARPPDARGRWLLPAPLAAAAGCRRTMTWSVRSRPDGTADVDLEVERDPDARTAEADMLAGPDEPGAGWEPLRPDAAGVLRARLRLPGGAMTGIRVRTVSEPDRDAP